MFDTMRKKEIAKRIKELRTGRKLSHQKLADELGRKYHINISPDSLKQYEIDDEYHTKWDKVQGMNIKYLYCIADYFNVSTDYLLANTDVKTPNETIQAIQKYTGLSEEVIEKLSDWKKRIEESFYCDSYLEFANTLLSSSYFYTLVNDYQNYLFSKELCKLLELENPETDFSARHSGTIIFTSTVPQEQAKKMLEKAKKDGEVTEEYFAEIEDKQPVQLFKMQRLFLDFIDKYATVETDNIKSIEEIIEKWNKKQDEFKKIDEAIESLKTTIKGWQERLKGGEE